MVETFELWFRREVAPFEGALRWRLRRLLDSDAEVEDVLWSAYEKVLVADLWRSAAAPVALVHSIARNLAIDHLRRTKVVSLEGASAAFYEAADETPGPEERMDDRRALRLVHEAVAQMPAQCRRVFVMRRIEGLSPAEIAERTGLSVSTIEKHVAKGLRLCAERLAQAGLERTSGRWSKRASPRTR